MSRNTAFGILCRFAFGKKKNKKEKEIARMPSQEDVGQAMQYTVSTSVHLCRRGFFSPHTQYTNSRVWEEGGRRGCCGGKKDVLFFLPPPCFLIRREGLYNFFQTSSSNTFASIRLFFSRSQRPTDIFLPGWRRERGEAGKNHRFSPLPPCLFLPLSSSCLACEGRGRGALPSAMTVAACCVAVRMCWVTTLRHR